MLCSVAFFCHVKRGECHQPSSKSYSCTNLSKPPASEQSFPPKSGLQTSVPIKQPHLSFLSFKHSSLSDTSDFLLLAANQLQKYEITFWWHFGYKPDCPLNTHMHKLSGACIYLFLHVHSTLHWERGQIQLCLTCMPPQSLCHRCGPGELRSAQLCHNKWTLTDIQIKTMQIMSHFEICYIWR